MGPSSSIDSAQSPSSPRSMNAATTTDESRTCVIDGQRLDHWQPDNGLILPGTIYVGSPHASGFDSRYYGPVEIGQLQRMEKLL